MTAIVRERPLKVIAEGDLTRTGITSGKPVTGLQWTSMAELSNYVMGHGGTLISANAAFDILAAGSSELYRYYVWPRYSTVLRLWMITLRAANTNARGTFEVDGNDIGEWTLSAGQTSERFMFWETVAQSSSAGEVTAEVFSNAASSGTVSIDEIACYEAPRKFLAKDANDVGADQDSCIAGSGIYDSSGYNSTGGVVDAAPSGVTIPRRNSHFHWFDPDGVSATTTAFTAVFALEPEVLGRHLYNGEGLGALGRTLTWTVYADGEPENDGQIKVTTTASAETSTITLNTDVAAWMTPATFKVDTEDISATSGLRGGVYSTLKFEIKKGESPWILYGISIGEA